MRTCPILLSLAVALGAACGDQGPTPVPGTYVLQHVDGMRLPIDLGTSYGTGEVDGQPVLLEMRMMYVSDTLRLRDDGTCERALAYRQIVRAYTNLGELVQSTDSVVSAAETGTYTVAGDSIAVTWSHGLVSTGTLTGDVLTLVPPSGAKWVYRRRA